MDGAGAKQNLIFSVTKPIQTVNFVLRRSAWMGLREVPAKVIISKKARIDEKSLAANRHNFVIENVNADVFFSSLAGNIQGNSDYFSIILTVSALRDATHL